MPIFECKNLSKSYGAVSALSNVNISIEPGRIVGLLGPNGSGKTTLIKLANGLLTPTDGHLLIDGEAPGPKTRKVVSYLPDRLCLPPWMSVVQLLDFFCDFYEDFDRQKASTCEKMQLILVMSRTARLYLLDEPIGGVDPATRDYIINTIIGNYNPQASVIISTHLIADVEQALDDVIFINNGQIVLQSSVDDIREKNGKSVDGLFREVFKC